MRKWRVGIVEDEPIARLGLRRMVAALPNATPVGEAGSGPEAVRLLCDATPDILFLDVQLPGGDAFEVLARADLAAQPAVVLVTAFEEHAVRAFEFGVTDYLLKPFDEPRFRRSWDRAVADRCFTDVEVHSSTTPSTPRVLLRRNGRVHTVWLAEVDWIEAADNYVCVHTATGHFMWRRPLRAVAEGLNRAGFAQVSRSALVNMERVTSLTSMPSGDGVVRLRNGHEVHVSRRFRTAFKALLPTIIPEESCE